MNVVLRVAAHTATLPFAGTTLESHLRDLVQAAGLTVVADAMPGAVVLDGRFASVSSLSLARLRGPGEALQTPSGQVIAAVGDSDQALRSSAGWLVADDECHDITVPGGLARAERAVRARYVARLESNGVHFVDPARVVVDTTVQVAPGVVIWPDVVLRGASRLQTGSEVRPGCWIEDSHIGEAALIKPHSVLTSAWVGPGSHVGPMAHLRPGARLVGDNKVGNFVEVKQAVLHHGAKASHLTYLGDAEVGSNANIGAGTITCNYDGHRKHRTVIGAGAFIGSNTALVAPIRIGDGAIVGAGSTLSRDVDADDLAVERGELRVLKGKGRSLNERNARLAARDKAAKADAPT